MSEIKTALDTWHIVGDGSDPLAPTTYLSGFTGSPSTSVARFKKENDRVELRQSVLLPENFQLVSTGAYAFDIFQLPTAYRPSNQVVFSNQRLYQLGVGYYNCQVVIQTTGMVQLLYYLDNSIRDSIVDPGQPIQLTFSGMTFFTT